MRRIRIRVRGMVQGVGFRFFTRSAARQLGLGGFVRNLPDGSVEAEAEGPEGGVGEFISMVRTGPSSSMVDGVEVEDIEPAGVPGDFEIRF